MRIAVAVVPVVLVVTCIPAVAATGPDFPRSATSSEDLARSANAPSASPRVSGRIVSGRLPGNRPFTLPPVGRPPYPAPGTVPGLPGGKSGSLVDPIPAYVPQTSCDPKEKPGITAFKKLVMSRYPAGADWGSSRNCSDDGISEHLEGRAWDWGVDVNKPAQFAAAAAVLQWLTANNGVNARRLGIMYIGYNYRIWGAYRAREGWRALNNSNPHTDHVHFSFSWNGAMKATSFWQGKTFAEDLGPCRIWANQPAPIRSVRNTKGCAAPVPVPPDLRATGIIWLGSTGSRVKQVQNKLKVTPTGFFGPVTQGAVANFQRSRGIPVTGVVHTRTWKALGIR